MDLILLLCCVEPWTMRAINWCTFCFCHQYRVKPIVNGKNENKYTCWRWKRKENSVFCLLKILWGVVSNSTNRSALGPNVRLRLYWVTVGDTQGEERLITVMLKKTKNKNNNGNVFSGGYGRYEYVMVMYRLTVFTSIKHAGTSRSVPSPSHSPKTIKTLTKKQKLFTLSNEDVWKHHVVCWPTDRFQPSFILQRPWIQRYAMLHLGGEEGRWKSASVPCTTVPAVRISSFSLECFNTRRNISLHWGNGSNSALSLIRSWRTFWSTVERREQEP